MANIKNPLIHNALIYMDSKLQIRRPSESNYTQER